MKIGVIGAGPGGLAVAINLLKLPFIDLNIYDQATELREVGAVSSDYLIRTLAFVSETEAEVRVSALIKTPGDIFVSLELLILSSSPQSGAMEAKLT